MNVCPVCGYDRLEFPPGNFSICACCGTEFGYDDRALTHFALRQEWMRAGFPWFDPDEAKPPLWNPYRQMSDARLPWVSPFKISLRLQADAVGRQIPSNRIEFGYKPLRTEVA